MQSSDESFIAPARSALMSRIGPRGSKAEMVVRRLAHRLGYRFRLHRRDLPGSPDLVFPGTRKVVFVHGCFWHRHAGCPRTTTPSTRHSFWMEKFARNTERDAQVEFKLRALGWDVLTIWECETTYASEVEKRLITFLGSPGPVRPKT
jgi:DNA mismatch endonuclease (patch repair protein)